MEPVRATLDDEPAAGAAPVTLVHGSTFLLAGRDGAAQHGTEGLYHADLRLLDLFALRLPGRRTEVLQLHQGDRRRMHVVLRSRLPGDALPDTDLVVAITTTVGDGRLVTRLVLRNLVAVPRRASWRLDVSGDFAPLFAIKEGRAAGSELTSVLVVSDGLELAGAGVSLRVTCPTAAVRADGLAEELVLPPHQTAQREIVVKVDHVEAPRPRPEPPEARRPRARLRTADAPLRGALRRSADDIDGLRMRDPLTGADVVAAGAPWFMTLFGRDSLITSLMTVGWDPTLAVGALTALAARQGQRCDDATEEEPGRIMHETRLVGGAGLFHGGGSVYYGSTDSSPLYVVLLDELDRWGGYHDVVDELLPAADAALEWCRDLGDLDHDGLLESHRRSPTGLLNQGWKDSWGGVPDDAGRPVAPPYALVEVQGYWYAALRARARLAGHRGDAATAARLRHEAAVLREHIDACFWDDVRGHHGLAVDSRKQRVGSLASNAGHLLWTGACSPVRAGALAATMLHRRLRTAWGLRTLARDHAAYNPLGYHVGSIWPHDTALVAWGLARWGFGHGCASLARGVVETADRLGGRLPELIAGFSPHDEVAGGMPVPYPTACSPQAWAAAAPMLLLRAVVGLEVDAWSRRLVVADPPPHDWPSMVVDAIPVAGREVAVRLGHGELDVVGLPPGWTVIRGAAFGPRGLLEEES